MTILDRYILKELFVPFSISLCILCFIVLTKEMLRLEIRLSIFLCPLITINTVSVVIPIVEIVKGYPLYVKSTSVRAPLLRNELYP